MQRILMKFIHKWTWYRKQNLRESLSYRSVGWKELLLIEGGLLECENWTSSGFFQLSFNLRVEFPQSLWIRFQLLHCSPENGVLYVQTGFAACKTWRLPLLLPSVSTERNFVLSLWNICSGSNRKILNYQSPSSLSDQPIPFLCTAPSMSHVISCLDNPHGFLPVPQYPAGTASPKLYTVL